MGLLIFLAVLALLGGLFIAPISFFKALSASGKAARLQQHLSRLELELNDMRTLCFQLRTDLRAMRPLASVPHPAEEPAASEEEAATTATEAAAEPAVVPKPAAEAPTRIEVESDAEEESAPDPPAANKPATLRHLINLQQQHRVDAAEQLTPAHAVEGDKEPAIASETQHELKPEPTEQPVASFAEQSTPDVDEPIIPPVSTPPLAVPDEPGEPDGRRLSIEEVLAGKVFVWIGAVALVLTAAFLLKLGFDENIITIPVRVIGAAVFGVALWCVGEWARTRVSLIAQALCGAAVAVLYGSILAADHYQLLGMGSGVAFGLMALVTTAAVVLSLRHGPAVAILGMLGGFMMPPLLVENMSPTLGMVLYLIAIEVGVLAVTGKRGWFGISLITLIFSVVWSIGYTLIGDQPHERTLTAMLVLGTAAAYIFHTARIHRDPAADPRSKRRVLGLSIAATCSAIGVVALLAVKGQYTPRDLSMLGIVALGTLVLARLDVRQIAMPFVAMAISFLVLASHAVQSLHAPLSDELIAMAVGFGGLFLLGGYACLWGSKHRRAFAVMTAIAGPAFYGLIIFAGQSQHGLREAWWPFTLGLAGVYAVLTLPMLLRRKSEHDWPIALFSVLSFALVCITLGQSLDHPWFAVGLALVSSVAAIIDVKLFIRPLRLAGVLVACISATLLVVPGPFELAIHGVPIFNTLLPMYLLPALAFGTIAWCAAKAGSATSAQNLTWLCVGTIAAMLLVLTRNIFQPVDFSAQAFQLYEWSTYATVLLLAGLIAHWIGNRCKYLPIMDATRVVVGIGAVLALIGGLAPSNPLFHADTVGGLQLAAGLLALYAAPAALLWLWSRRPAIQATPQLAEVLRGVSITLVTLFVGLQIRNGFAGTDLQAQTVGLYECVCYFAAALLLGGLIQWLNQRFLRDTVTQAAGQIIFGIGFAVTFVGCVFAFNPIFDRDAVGGWDLAGRMAVLYGVPIALLWLGSRSKTLARQNALINALRGTAIGYLALFVGVLIRIAFQTDDIHARTVGLFECTTYGLAWAALGYAFYAIAPRCTLPQTTANTGRTVFGVGLLTLIFGNVFVLNPLWFKEAVGSAAVFNGLWYVYGPLILILALLARMARRQQLPTQAKLAGFMAVGLSFMLLTMFVRHGFSSDGYVLIKSGLNDAERYAYSLAWVVFGGVLLVAGVFTRLDTLRYGSLAVLLLAVGKVFLIDTANLDNLYRVLSFFGLGVTLIGLGYLYQRLVFKRPLTPNKPQAA